MRAGQVPTHSPGERRKIRGPDRGLRFAHDSLLEGGGFELPVPDERGYGLAFVCRVMGLLFGAQP